MHDDFGVERLSVEGLDGQEKSTFVTATRRPGGFRGTSGKPQPASARTRSMGSNADEGSCARSSELDCGGSLQGGTTEP